MARNSFWDSDKLCSNAPRVGAGEPGAAAATRRVEGAPATAAAILRRGCCSMGPRVVRAPDGGQRSGWAASATAGCSRRKRLAAMCLVAVLSLALCRTAAAQTPTIPMPSDLKVNSPAANVPANIARFIGAWARGAWDGVLPHVLVVESVDGTGRAQVVYAVGD